MGIERSRCLFFYYFLSKLQLGIKIIGSTSATTTTMAMDNIGH